MLLSLLNIILVIFFSFFPLLIWGYGNIYLSHHVWNRARFFAGIIGGAISIACILFFRRGLSSSGHEQIWAVIGVFIVLGILTGGVIMYGSPYIRGFLRRTLFLHITLFSLLLYGWGFVRDFIPMTTGTLSFFAGMGGFFIAAYLEEGVKHVSSIGLTAKDFRFSRIDLLLFTFFIALGFVTVENTLYLIEAYKTGILSVFITGIYRILFAIPLHIFTASICVMFWWKALSYDFFSWKYISFLLSGFIVATIIHSIYNLLIEKNSILSLMILVGIGYMAFTQWILLDATHLKKYHKEHI